MVVTFWLPCCNQVGLQLVALVQTPHETSEKQICRPETNLCISFGGLRRQFSIFLYHMRTFFFPIPVASKI